MSFARSEVLVPGPAEALAGLLGVEGISADDERGLPLLWHWVYLLERPTQSQLGVDGHPVSGSLPIPPRPGLRRMFAGGRVTRERPLLLGEPASRASVVVSTTEKTGRSGSLTFVTVQHQILQRGAVAVVDEQDLVYREGGGAGAADCGPQSNDLPAGAVSAEWVLDPTLLFRFSALTYNGHRIHYDREYAVGIEGHPGLVVHGPLQAVAMLEVHRSHHPSAWPQRFEYRLTAPLFDFQGLAASACQTGSEVETEVRDRSGRRTAVGRIFLSA